MVYSIFTNRIAMAIISYVVFIISATVHEFSHAKSAYSLGDETAYSMGRITLNPRAHMDILGSVVLPIIAAITGVPVIGWMKPVPVNPYNFKNPESGQAIVSFAGPFSNLVIAFLSFLLIKLLTMEISGVPLIYKFLISSNATQNSIAMTAVSTGLMFIWMFYLLNIMLMMFNLFPFPPLDGGWILRFFLPYKGKQVYDSIYPYGFLFLYALLFLGVLRTVLGGIQSLGITLLGNSINILFSI